MRKGWRPGRWPLPRSLLTTSPRSVLAPEQRDQPGQPLALERAEAADVGDLVRQARRVEEAQGAEVQQHAGVALGQQRGVERPAARGGVAEAELVAEDRLARPGHPLED